MCIVRSRFTFYVTLHANQFYSLETRHTLSHARGVYQNRVSSQLGLARRFLVDTFVRSSYNNNDQLRETRAHAIIFLFALRSNRRHARRNLQFPTFYLLRLALNPPGVSIARIRFYRDRFDRVQRRHVVDNLAALDSLLFKFQVP